MPLTVTVGTVPLLVALADEDADALATSSSAVVLVTDKAAANPMAVFIVIHASTA